MRSLRETVDALIAYLQSIGLTAYDTQVPNAPRYPYALIESRSTARRDRVALGGAQSWSGRVIVTSAGLTAGAVRAVASRVHDALRDWRPGVLDGHQIGRVTHDAGVGLPVSADTTHGIAPVYFAVDHYVLHATPSKRNGETDGP